MPDEEVDVREDYIRDNNNADRRFDSSDEESSPQKQSEPDKGLLTII